MLFLLNARDSPMWRRARRPPRGLSAHDWMDAQAAAARMPGRWRVARPIMRAGRPERRRLAELAA
jgi:hypothetical protein